MKLAKSCTIIFLVTILFSLGVFAQTTKAKPKRKTLPIVLPTPPINEPEIVSTVGDNLGQPQPTPPIVEPQETPESEETLFEKIDKISKRIKDLGTRVGSIEANQKKELDDKQKKLLLNLDILTRAEQRAESLRKQLFEIIEKENEIKKKFDETEYLSRSENIERVAALTGSLRPEDIREQRKKALETEKSNMRALLVQIQSTRTNLEDSVAKADLLVEKLRFKLEKEIDEALSDNPK